MSTQNKKIDLFHKYDLSFHNRVMEEMIKVLKTWKVLYPGTSFRQEYNEYLRQRKKASNQPVGQ